MRLVTVRNREPLVIKLRRNMVLEFSLALAQEGQHSTFRQAYFQLRSTLSLSRAPNLRQPSRLRNFTRAASRFWASSASSTRVRLFNGAGHGVVVPVMDRENLIPVHCRRYGGLALEHEHRVGFSRMTRVNTQLRSLQPLPTKWTMSPQNTSNSRRGVVAGQAYRS